MSLVQRNTPWILSLGCFLACSDYHGVLFSNGSPDTVVVADTLYIPGDTVSLPTGFAHTDTLLDYEFVVRPGRTITVNLRSSAYGTADSVVLLASMASSDSLRFSFKDSADASRDLRHSASVQGDRIRQDLSALLQPSDRYTLQWTWPDSATASRLLMAVGASPLSVKSGVSYSITESSSLPTDCDSTVSANGGSWCMLPVVAGDVLQGSITADASLKAYVLIGSAMDDYFTNPNQMPTSYLYSREAMGDSFSLNVTTTDTLYWFVYNPTSSAITFQDSLLSSSQILP